MKRLAFALLMLCSTHALAERLVADIPEPGFPTLPATFLVDFCDFYKHPGTTTNAALLTSVPVTTDPVIGSPTYGNRVCAVDLTGKTITGINNINLRSRSTTLGVASPFVPFAFPSPSTLMVPSGLRLAP